MAVKTPSYITTNRLGIYVFQIRIPKHLSHNQNLFRKSLCTRNRSEADIRSRKLWLLFTQQIEQGSTLQSIIETLHSIKLSTQSHIEWPETAKSTQQQGSNTSSIISLTAEQPPLSKQYETSSNDSKAIQQLIEQNEILVKQNQEIQRKFADLQQQITPAKGADFDSKPLVSLIDEFIAERKTSWKPKNAKKNIDSLKPKLLLLTDVIGNIESAELQPSHIVEFKKSLLQLPSNRTKGIYDGKSIPEITAMDIPDDAKMASETRRSYLNRMSTFLNWLAENNHAQENLSIPLSGVRLETKPDHEQRSAFTDQELTKLFEAKQYTETRHKQPSHYWVPLLALFTGARQTELCQLYKLDIQQDKETEIWYIDINQNTEDKSLKKPSHARLVPIHEQLISLGFLDYVSNVSHQRLFSDLTLKRDGYGQKFSRWFCDTYLNEKNCGIKKINADSPVFHSFRHTVETQLDHQHNISDHHIAHLVGQKPSGKSVTTNRYIKPKQLRDNLIIINKLNYPSIEFSRILHWELGFDS